MPLIQVQLLPSLVSLDKYDLSLSLAIYIYAIGSNLLSCTISTSTLLASNTGGSCYYLTSHKKIPFFMIPMFDLTKTLPFSLDTLPETTLPIFMGLGLALVVMAGFHFHVLYVNCNFKIRLRRQVLLIDSTKFKDGKT